MDEYEDFNEKLFDEAESEEDKVMQILLNSREQGQLIENMIKNQIEVKDRMIDKLHEELEYYKQDSAGKFIDQFMKAIIKVRKDMIRIIDSDKWDDFSEEDIKREYRYIFDDLTDMLEQQNVDAYRTDAGEYFDASVHQARIEQTDNPELDRTIKESLGEGYKKGNKVLQPEKVVVYRYKA